jgi:exosortase
MLVFLAGVFLHLLGYAIQQARLSVLGFFAGIYGMGGVFWGAGWMRKAIVPFALFVFCVPLGNATEILTFPLRLAATKITAVSCQLVLGVDVIQRGNQLFDAGGHYQYEVAAACSGIQSLTAVMALALIYSYLNFRSLTPTALMLIAGLPLAVVANVARLVMIVVAAEAFGQQAGDYVHASGVLSLLPYIPAIGGMFLVGRLLKRFFAEPAPADGGVLVPKAAAGAASGAGEESR